MALELTQRFLYPPIQIAYRQRAIEDIISIADRRDLLVDFFIMLVRNIADDFFQQIFQRDDPFDASMLVDDKSEMGLRFLHLAQYILQTRRVYDVHWRL